MDYVSSLLQEAQPLYNKRKSDRKQLIHSAFAVVCFSLIVVPLSFEIRTNNDNFEYLYNSLYVSHSTEICENQQYYIDEFDAMGVI